MQDTKTPIPEQGERILIPVSHRDPNQCDFMQIVRVVKEDRGLCVRISSVTDFYNRNGRFTGTRISRIVQLTVPVEEIEIAKQTKKMRLWRLKHTEGRLVREAKKG